MSADGADWIADVVAERCPNAVRGADPFRIAAHQDAIHVSIDHDLSNGLVESVNTKLRLLTRMAFGYADPHALIGLGLLAPAGCAHRRPAAPPGR